MVSFFIVTFRVSMLMTFRRGFRCHRILGIMYILENQANARSELRARPNALLLTATAVWLLNGIISRPDDGPASRDLMTVVLPHTLLPADPDDLAFYPPQGMPDEDDSDVYTEPGCGTHPYHPYGAYFVRRIRLEGCPRFRLDNTLNISEKSFVDLFKCCPREIERNL